MGTNGRPSRFRPRWRTLGAALPPAAAGLGAALIAGSGSAPAAPAPAPSYAALSGGETGGLVISDSPTPRGAAPRPTWPAHAPEGSGDRPAASSIRRVRSTVPGLSAWIARSAAGGVCVLLYDGQPVDGVAAVYASCSTPERFGAGATVQVSEIPNMPGRVIEAGVVPDGVEAVSTRLADGSSATSQVSDNAWARSGGEPPAPGAEPTAITGG
jgi:hypothetical protein